MRESIVMTVSVRCFFFSSRRRHTRYWRDWSSDVCSSDLGARDASVDAAEAELEGAAVGSRAGRDAGRVDSDGDARVLGGAARVGVHHRAQIGRASCRERVEISVVAGSLKKNDARVDSDDCVCTLFFFFKQKTAYEILA